MADDVERDLIDETLENLPLAVAMFNKRGAPVFMNRLYREYHRAPTVEAFGATLDEHVNQMEQDDRGFKPGMHLEALRKALAAGKEFACQIERDGRILAVHDVPLKNGYFMSTQRDITAQVKAERQIAHMAHHDNLTDLPNRAAFSAALENAIAESRAKQQRFAVFAIDVDRFKDVNDLYGHAAGDALLREIAVRFEKILPGGMSFRFGGDEFMLINRNCASHQAAGLFGDRILHDVAGEFRLEGRDLTVGLSVGVGMFPLDGDDAKTLLKNADAALYRAKGEGRGIVRFYEAEMDDCVHLQRQLMQDLRHAVERKELTLHYQPQATTQGELTGFEALARWTHAERGDVPPADFIPLAEDSGLILQIGEWVLTEACREAASWNKKLSISVNMSPIQFRQRDLVEMVARVLGDTGLAPDRLEIEITESVLVEDFSRALAVLRGLKDLGVRIAMDDFGTGYSSLSYLQSFPFDKLKIDRSFIARLDENEHSKEIIRAVLGLGRGLNLPIVAEGVETASQLQFLAAEHCDGVQGFLVGRPQPIDAYGEQTRDVQQPTGKRAGKRRA